MQDHPRYLAALVHGIITAAFLILIMNVTTRGWWTLLPYAALAIVHIVAARHIGASARATFTMLLAFAIASAIVYAYILTIVHPSAASAPWPRQVWPVVAFAGIGIGVSAFVAIVSRTRTAAA